MEAFPAFFPLNGARVAIAGEGDGAEAKARLLAGSPATVVRLAGVDALKAENYAGSVLAFVAGGDEAFRQGAAAAARVAGATVNVVDHPDLSDFHTPAIIDRGQVVVAIGTAGAAPMLAAILRADLEALIPKGMGALAALLGQVREPLRAAFPDLPQRRAFLRAVLDGPVAEAAMAGNMAAAEGQLRAQIEKGMATIGKVWLIAAPLARDLLSLRAAGALGMADVLVVGDGVPAGVTGLARRDATWRTLVDTDDQFLADAAARGQQAVVVAEASELAFRAVELAGLGVACEVLAPATSW